MKKTLTLLLFISILNFLHSQNSFLKKRDIEKKKEFVSIKNIDKKNAATSQILNQFSGNDFIKMDSYNLFIPDENSNPEILKLDLKIDFIYNDLGQNVSTTFYQLNDDILEKDEYYEKNYDGKGRLMEYIEYEVTNNEVIPSDKSIYTYYENNLLKEDSYWEWNGASWDSLGRENFVYDELGRLVESNYSYVIFGDPTKLEISYSDTLITKISSTFDTNNTAYIPHTKEETRFYGDKEVTLIFSMSNNGTWEVYDKIEKVISNNGKTITDLYFSYDESTFDLWHLEEKNETTLNNFNKVSSYLYENYFDNGNIEYGHLEEYNYSNEGVLQEVIYSNYNDSADDYVYDLKEELKSDINYSKENMLLPFEDDDEESAKYIEYKLDTLNRYSFEPSTDEWVLEENGIFHYSLFSPSSTDDKTIADVNVYPNPTSNYLYFETEGPEIKSIKLYNANGILIKEISGNINKVDVSTLNSGVYFYTLQSKSNEVKSGKVIVSR